MHTIITGTGRCGTSYVQKALGHLGVLASHETVFTIDGPSHRNAETFEVEVGFLAGAHLGEPWLEGVRVVHLVRQPQRVIRSFLRMGFWQDAPGFWPYWRWAENYVPELKEAETPLEKAAIWVTRWNRRIEPYADLRWRVEDDVRGLLDWLGVGYRGKSIFADTSYNTRSNLDLEPEWGILDAALQADIETLMADYGYTDLRGAEHG
jgi:hypothetical protein